MEYVGEVLTHTAFAKRAQEYAKKGIQHHYFMALDSEEVITVLIV